MSPTGSRVRRVTTIPNTITTGEVPVGYMPTPIIPIAAKTKRTIK
jgi:hypothetical protein